MDGRLVRLRRADAVGVTSTEVELRVCIARLGARLE
jgi:hypothetical protein